MMLPFALVTILGAVLAASFVFDGSLFSYHPTAMILAFFVFGANAVRAMKVFRSKNTHMLLQLVAATLVVVGMTAIYLKKEEHGRPHWWTANASWHAWSGAAASIIFLFATCGAFFAFGPFASSKTLADKHMRSNHAAAGAIGMTIFGGCILSGWYKMYGVDGKFYAISGMFLLVVVFGLSHRILGLFTSKSKVN